MAEVELKLEGSIRYREAVPGGEPEGEPVVLVHGFPESSRMWIRTMNELADRGRRCVAPDLYCLGDSSDPGPATFERNLGAFGEWIDELALEKVALVVHDWGGFIGLAWACENPDRVAAIVISDTGFFADGRWHGMAQALRAEGGEKLVEALDRSGFEGLLHTDGAAFTEDDVDAYWAPFENGRGREATVEFYRSMNFEKLAPYEGKLAAIGVPVLMLWGAEDRFAPLSGGRRFEREIPGSKLVAIEGAGHFVFDQEPQRCSTELVAFLGGA